MASQPYRAAKSEKRQDTNYKNNQSQKYLAVEGSGMSQVSGNISSSKSKFAPKEQPAIPKDSAANPTLLKPVDYESLILKEKYQV